MSTQMEKREAQVMDVLQLEGIKNQLSDLMAKDPKGIAKFKSRMIKMSLNSMLLNCSPESIINCGLQAATLDLPLEAGQGYIVKYGKEAQLDIGSRGWALLAKRSGYSVLADSVYNCDLFDQSGFGFDATMTFEPNANERKISDDKWAQANIKGVIVSVKEQETGEVIYKWVPADILIKIMGMSPGASSKFSPYANWFDSMMCAKAIKQVMSKMPIDLTKGAALNDAIQYSNKIESEAQAQPQGLPAYPQSRFDDFWPKWIAVVKSGKKTAVQIITPLTNGHSLSEAQMQKIMTLANYEPIDGELVDEPESGEQPNTVFAWAGDDEYKSRYKEWRIMVEAGEITVDDLLDMVKKHNENIPADSIKAIEGLRDCAPVAEAS